MKFAAILTVCVAVGSLKLASSAPTPPEGEDRPPTAAANYTHLRQKRMIFIPLAIPEILTIGKIALEILEIAVEISNAQTELENPPNPSTPSSANYTKPRQKRMVSIPTVIETLPWIVESAIARRIEANIKEAQSLFTTPRSCMKPDSSWLEWARQSAPWSLFFTNYPIPETRYATTMVTDSTTVAAVLDHVDENEIPFTE